MNRTSVRRSLQDAERVATSERQSGNIGGMEQIDARVPSTVITCGPDPVCIELAIRRGSGASANAAAKLDGETIDGAGDTVDCPVRSFTARAEEIRSILPEELVVRSPLFPACV